MEENTVELIDYLRVIWKRRILIIVVTLVGIVIGVGVVTSRLKLPATYRASAVVKIGKKVRLLSTSNISISTSTLVEYIENPELLVQTIPIDFKAKAEESQGYHLSVERVGSLAMLRLTLKGPDEGVKGVLKETVDMLIDEHRRKANDSVVAYKDYMKILETDAKMIRKTITEAEASIKDMKRKEGEYLVNIESKRNEIQAEKDGGDRSAFLNMLYLKTIDKEKDLTKSRADLRSIQSKLLMHQITLGNLEEYKTEVLGEVKCNAVKPKNKSFTHIMTVAGVAGLIMSLFIAFFMEYIEESKSRRKGK